MFVPSISPLLRIYLKEIIQHKEKICVHGEIYFTIICKPKALKTV